MVTFKCNEIIPGGLAKRVGFYMTHSVVKLNNPKLTSEYAPASPSTQSKIEIRVLDFQI